MEKHTVPSRITIRYRFGLVLSVVSIFGLTAETISQSIPVSRLTTARFVDRSPSMYCSSASGSSCPIYCSHG